MALDFFAGCIGGLTGVGAGHPFDTVKVRLQTQKAGTYSGTYHCFSSIVRKEGALGLYKGITSPMAGLSFINAIVFGVNGIVKRHLPHPESLTSIFAAGSFAGAVQSVISSPMELCKTRIQLQGLGVPQYFHVFFMPFHSQNAKQAYLSEKYHNPLHCAITVYRENGVMRGLYRGFTMTMIRDTLGFGVYFSSYSYFVEMFRHESDSHSVSSLGYFMAGGLGGTVSWLLNYPVDVIKSKYQADGASGPFQYKSYYDCFKTTYQELGIRGFSVGLTSTLLRAFPMNAVTFLTIEWVYKLWGNKDEEMDSSPPSRTEIELKAIMLEKSKAADAKKQHSRKVASGTSILHP